MLNIKKKPALTCLMIIFIKLNCFLMVNHVISLKNSLIPLSTLTVFILLNVLIFRNDNICGENSTYMLCIINFLRFVLLTIFRESKNIYRCWLDAIRLLDTVLPVSNLIP